MSTAFCRRLVLIGGCAWCLPALAASPKADRIVVVKSDRRLDLLRDGQVIRSYPVRLGRNPVGPKIFQLDGRTPEGIYTIDSRSRASAFHLALHISYPQAENVARAAKYNLPAGGAIFIHGTPGTGKRFERDWTDGCIAVSNRAIEEIWTLVDDGTPVEIRP
jgi:murein L,D-transpeptidase YafK